MKCPKCDSNSKYKYVEPRIGDAEVRRDWKTKCNNCGYTGVEPSTVEKIDDGSVVEHVKKSPIGKAMEKTEKNE